MKISFIDIEQELRGFCPNLISYYGPTDDKLERISEKYNKRVQFNMDKLKCQDPFQIKTTIYDLVIAAIEGNMAAKYFLKHIDDISKSLFDNVPKVFHDSLKKSYLGIFENFGDSESKYLDKVGELAILEKIILNSEYKLHRIEHKLENNKSIDFSFKTIGNPDELILIEVYNIHLNSERLEDNEKFKKFIVNRLESKFHDKLEGIEPELNKSYYFIPVIWCNLEDLVKYNHIFLELKKNSIIPEVMTFLQLTDSNNYYSFNFNSINIILNDYAKHHNIKIYQKET